MIEKCENILESKVKPNKLYNSVNSTDMTVT